MYIVIPCTTTYQFPLIGTHAFCNSTTNPTVSFSRTRVRTFHCFMLLHQFLCSSIITPKGFMSFFNAIILAVFGWYTSQMTLFCFLVTPRYITCTRVLDIKRVHDSEQERRSHLYSMQQISTRGFSSAVTSVVNAALIENRWSCQFLSRKWKKSL